MRHTIQLSRKHVCIIQQIPLNHRLTNNEVLHRCKSNFTSHLSTTDSDICHFFELV